MKHYVRFDKEYQELVKPIWGKEYNELKAMDGQVITVNAGTDEEYLLVPEEIVDTFHTISISREDFEGYGFDASKLTDKDMQRIADGIAESINEYDLYDYIDYWAGEYRLPTIEKNDDD